MFSALLLLISCVVATLPQQPIYPGLHVVYEDDFNYLNENVWTKLDGFVQTPYASVCYRADDVYTADGSLHLRTRRRDSTCTFKGESKNYAFTSGWVDTHSKRSFRDGLIEVRSKIPPPVNRIWPAVWIIEAANDRDRGKCWPIAEEADIYEMTGGLGTSPICGSMHWGYECNVDRGNKYGCTPRPAEGTYNVYAIRWSQKEGGYVAWFLNGVEVRMALRA